jgi:hypothetical protein
LVSELEHLKIETRLIDEMFASEMGEYVFLILKLNSENLSTTVFFFWVKSLFLGGEKSREDEKREPVGGKETGKT